MTAKKSRKISITPTAISKLKAGEKDYVVRDTTLRGFQIKVPPKGELVYQVEARLGGKGAVKKFKIGNVKSLPLDTARKNASIALQNIRSGIDPLIEKRRKLHEGILLKDLLQKYLDAKTLKERTKNDYIKLANTRLTQWLNHRVIDITNHEVTDWYVKGRSRPVNTEHAFRLLNALMVYARGLQIIKESPCQMVTDTKIRRPIRKRTEHLEINSDLEPFLIALSQYNFVKDSEKTARDVIVLILTTGLRSQEARSLKWGNIDFARKRFTIPDPKNRRPHVVPMTPLTYTMFRMREQLPDKTDYVFRIKGNTKSPHVTDIRKTIKNICVKAEIKTVTPHDMRRTFSTTLNSLGVGFADQKHLMNHKEKDVTLSHYIQPNIEVLRGHLFKVVDFYDRKIPHFTQGQGVSKFTSGTLRFCLYNVGDLTPELLDNPLEEDAEYQAYADHDFWEN
ncbi:MAG: hypothetical protein CMH27_02855 [Micavibrio sp.]|nr:hypothetical protein [Micavibrio sp.]|tara:strand:- start:8526 stop:9878 length:1353 start_codon:yes stop_codon:yes gene_type:complete